MTTLSPLCSTTTSPASKPADPPSRMVTASFFEMALNTTWLRGVGSPLGSATGAAPPESPSWMIAWRTVVPRPTSTATLNSPPEAGKVSSPASPAT